MTEQDISEILSNYIVANWQVLLIGVFSSLGTIILSTWFVAKHWYQREIKHVKNQKHASDELSRKECSYLTKQVKDKEAYAKGVIEVMGQRLALAEEKPNNLLKVIQQQDIQLLDFQKKLKEQQKLINNVRKNVHIVLAQGYSEKTIHMSCRKFWSDVRFRKIDNTYKEVMLLKNRDKDKKDIEILMLSNLVTLQSKKLIEKNIEINSISMDFLINNMDLIKHFIKVIIPLIDKEVSEYKPLIFEFSKAIEKSGFLLNHINEDYKIKENCEKVEHDLNMDTLDS